LKEKNLSTDSLDADNLPDNYPHRKNGLCGSEPLFIPNLVNEIENIDNQRDNISKHADMDKADVNECNN
jgi:hypothetical protein